MTLELDPAEAGHWRDPAWDGTTPGTLAVIVGVSSYPYLRGGQHEVAEHFGLGQLAVSALTAFCVFEWLRDYHYFEQCPVVDCRLLLSPTDQELAAAPGMAGSFGPADYASCEAAVLRWREALRRLDDQVAGASRGVFFFSGHGVEITADQQVLLPSDYLNPDPARQLNKALATQNLSLGMKQLNSAAHIFFMDACRNDTDLLREHDIRGNPIFDEPRDTSTINPNLLTATMHATATNAKAWQQPSPDKGLSLFGDALLAAVNDEESVDWQEQPPAVMVGRLQSQVKRTVQKLLKDANARQAQPVVASGDAPVVHWRDQRTRTMGERDAGVVFRGYRHAIEDGLARVTFEDHAEMIAGDGWEVVDPHADPDEHRWFGSEQITAAWGGATLIDPLTGDRGPRPEVLGVARVETARHRLRVAVPPRTWWLQLDHGGGRHAALLPPVPGAEFELDMTWTEDRHLERLDVDLANEAGPLARPAQLWDLYRATDASSASATIGELSEDDLAAARGLVATKGATPQSPLAAIVAVLVMLRAGKAARIPPGWMANLATWFPHLPDGAALRAEHLARLGRDAPSPPSAALVDLLLRQTVPFTSEAAAYALSLAERLAANPEDPWRPAVDALAGWLGGLRRYFHPGGLFLVLMDPAREMHPGLVVSPAAEVLGVPSGSVVVVGGERPEVTVAGGVATVRGPLGEVELGR